MSTTQAFPEYVENEYTETMWVRRDLADSPETAVNYLVDELGIDPLDAESASEVHMRLYPPDHPDAPHEARMEGADYMQVVPEADDTCAYWQMRP